MNATAVGAKGVYTIDPRNVLTAIGHDSLPMLALPPDGRQFVSRQHALDTAEALDRTSTYESQASGT